MHGAQSWLSPVPWSLAPSPAVGVCCATPDSGQDSDSSPGFSLTSFSFIQCKRTVNFCLSVHAIATIQPIIPHDARRCRKIGTPLAAERTSRRPADCLDTLDYTLIPHPSAPPPLASLHFFLSCLLHPPALLLPVSADRQDALTNCNKMCIQCTQPFF